MRFALLDVIVVVAVTPQSPPSPIPAIRQTWTLDTPIDVFIINAVIDFAHSRLCPPLVAGQVWHALLLPPHVVIESSSPRSPNGVDITCLGGEQQRDANLPLSQLDEQ